jgi:hypothetical protein
MEPDTPKPDKRITRTERKRKALELRMKGLGFKQIADELGWKSHSSAHDAVMSALRETLQEPADELRILEAERLNKLYEHTMNRIDKDNLWAVDRALKIMERRAGLLGLDMKPERDMSREADAFLSGVHTVREMQGSKDLSE